MHASVGTSPMLRWSELTLILVTLAPVLWAGR
jgi:hypothetical protein